MNEYPEPAAGRVAWIVGASSGIGAASARALAAAGFQVALTGRREEVLRDLANQLGGSAVPVPADVTHEGSLRDAHQRIRSVLGRVSLLVYSAGTNSTERFWNSADPGQIASVIDTNLTGAIRAVAQVIGPMRQARDGQIVLVSSWAAWRFSRGAGIGYSASKIGLATVAETINAEEHGHGVRATHLCPGEVRTDILQTRPVVPTEREQQLMLAPQDIGRAIVWIASWPASVCVNELVVTPTANVNYD